MEKKSKDSGETVARYFKYGFIGLFVLVVAAVCLTIYLSNVKSYVATVGSEKVNVAEFNFYLKQVKDSMLSEAGISAGTPEADTFWSTAKFNGENAIDQAKKSAMDSVKETKVQVAKAKEQKIVLEKQDTDYIGSLESQIITDNQNSRTEADKYLESTYNVNLDELKEIYKDFIFAQKLYQKETTAMNVTEDEIKKFYDENKDSVDSVTVRHILISTQDTATGAQLSEEKIKEAENKANDILKQVQAGGDMKALAKQYSQDPGVTDNEGEYTFVKSDGYLPEFKDWAFKAKVNDVGIVKTDAGYHVMKLEKRTTYEEAKQNAKNYILSDRYTKSLEEWKKDPKYEMKITDSVYNSIK